MQASSKIASSDKEMESNMFEKIRNTALLLMFPAVLVGMYGFCFRGWDTFPILFALPFAFIALCAFLTEGCD
jgi:hypothetical protein